MINPKSTYREQVELVNDILKEPRLVFQVALVRKFLINHGYEQPDSSDKAIETLPTKVDIN